MLRLTHLTGSRMGQVDSSPKAVLRIGRGGDCDVQFDAARDKAVSTHHAEIRFDGNGYTLYDTNSSNGTFVNGKRVQQHKLKGGETIYFGGDIGPQVRFEIVDDMSASRPVVANNAPRAAPMAPMAPKPASGGSKGTTDDYDIALIASQAAAKARASRQATGGAPSGQTMFMMIDAIQQAVEVKKSGWKKWAFVGAGVAVAIIVTLVIVVMLQASKLNEKVGEKKNLDADIAKLQAQIELEGDDAKRGELVAKLELLTGKAAALTQDLESNDKGRDALKKAGVNIDSGSATEWNTEREIRTILRQFDGDTYIVPKPFKDRIDYYLDLWGKKQIGGTRTVWSRRRQFWPMIQRAFAEERVPEAMAYVAWVESNFDPEICSYVGARGMWQFMPATGRKFGLQIASSIDSCKPKGNEEHCNCPGVDERLDPYKSSKAGAQYLGSLLSQFGEESFMLAIASYNKGEEGMRQVLTKNKLRTKAERDFWHLYYLKLLPEETLEYVPRIISAAIIAANPKHFGLE